MHLNMLISTKKRYQSFTGFQRAILNNIQPSQKVLDHFEKIRFIVPFKPKYINKLNISSKIKDFEKLM